MTLPSSFSGGVPRFSQAFAPLTDATMPDIASAMPEMSTPWDRPSQVRQAIATNAIIDLLQLNIFFI